MVDKGAGGRLVEPERTTLPAAASQVDKLGRSTAQLAQLELSSLTITQLASAQWRQLTRQARLPGRCDLHPNGYRRRGSVGAGEVA